MIADLVATVAMAPHQREQHIHGAAADLHRHAVAQQGTAPGIEREIGEVKAGGLGHQRL